MDFKQNASLLRRHLCQRHRIQGGSSLPVNIISYTVALFRSFSYYVVVHITRWTTCPLHYRGVSPWEKKKSLIALFLVLFCFVSKVDLDFYFRDNPVREGHRCD